MTTDIGGLKESVHQIRDQYSNRMADAAMLAIKEIGINISGRGNEQVWEKIKEVIDNGYLD